MVGAMLPTDSRDKTHVTVLYNVFECLFRDLFTEAVSMALLETRSSFNLLWLRAVQMLLLNLQP